MIQQATQGSSLTPVVVTRAPARAPARASTAVAAAVADPVAAPLPAPSPAQTAPPPFSSKIIPSLVKDVCAEMRAVIRHAVQDQMVGMRHQLLPSPSRPDVYSSAPPMAVPYPMAQPVQPKHMMMMMPRRPLPPRTYHSPAFDGANPGYGFNSIDYDWA